MLDTVTARGTRGAYRKEDRVQLPPELQKELVEKAAAKYGNCQELAKHLNIPKSSVHYYRIGRLTMPASVMEHMLMIADDSSLTKRVRGRGIAKDRTWANEYSASIYREMCRDKLKLPTREELQQDDVLRRKAAAIVSYMMAEGSIWLQKEKFGELAANITFGSHETDLYDHFRRLCIDVFNYEIGEPQLPGNGAEAIRGFIYSRFVCEWLAYNGVRPGEKASRPLRLPDWVLNSDDVMTLISSVQPWCDGEGSAISSPNSKTVRFLMSQSRHTDLSLADFPLSLAGIRHRSIGLNEISRLDIHGMPALSYLMAFSRSEIFDDVREILLRLGLKPKYGISGLRLKDDGYWSSVWTITFRSEEVPLLVKMGIIIQNHKVMKITRARQYQ